MNRLLIAAAAILAIVPIPQAAAQSAELDPGMRVRLSVGGLSASGSTHSAPGETLVGHIDRVEHDSLWVHMDTMDGPIVAVDRARIWRAEISRGLKGDPGKGALYGGGFGLGLGIVGALALDDDCHTGIDNFDICEGHEATIIAGSALAGAAAGGLVGLLVKTEQWMDVSVARPIVRAESGGVSLGLQVGL